MRSFVKYFSMIPIPGLSPLTVRGEQRSYESSMWLLPTPQGFGSTNPLVFTPSRNYTASDYQALFQATGNFQVCVQGIRAKDKLIWVWTYHSVISLFEP